MGKDIFTPFLDENDGLMMHRYLQVEEYVKQLIESEQFKDGDCLPTETELAQQFEISRPTVRQAMSNLVNQGYITRVRGKGSFVTKPKILQESTRFIESYNVEMSKKGLIPKTILLDMVVETPNPFIMDKLSLKQKEKVVRLKRLRYAVSNGKTQERPVLLTEVFIPLRLIPNLIEYDFESFSLYEVFEQNGIYLKKVRREIEARLCESQVADILEVKENSAIQFITSIGYLEDGTVIEYSQSIYPAERNKFVVEIIR